MAQWGEHSCEVFASQDQLISVDSCCDGFFPFKSLARMIGISVGVLCAVLSVGSCVYKRSIANGKVQQMFDIQLLINLCGLVVMLNETLTLTNH